MLVCVLRWWVLLPSDLAIVHFCISWGTNEYKGEACPSVITHAKKSAQDQAYIGFSYVVMENRFLNEFLGYIPFQFLVWTLPQTLPDMVPVIPSITALGPSTEPSIVVDWISPGAVLGFLRIAWGYCTIVGWGSSSGCETHSRGSQVCSWSWMPAWCLEYRLYIRSGRMECSADGV